MLFRSRKRFDALSFKAPGASLEALDGLSQRLVWAGFPLFTVAMVLGMIWVDQRGSSMLRPEYSAAMLTWITYAVLLGVRTGLGWRGRRAAWLTLAGFAAALTVLAIVTLNPWWLLGSVLSGYAFAWIGHFTIEHNRPATFTYPFWSLWSDFRMYGLWIAGRLGPHLRRAGVGAA